MVEVESCISYLISALFVFPALNTFTHNDSLSEYESEHGTDVVLMGTPVVLTLMEQESIDFYGTVMPVRTVLLTRLALFIFTSTREPPEPPRVTG